MINPFWYLSPGGDSYFANVASLLHFDGADGSTTFTDVTGKTWTAFNQTQIDTAQSKFGGASGLFDGSADYIATPNHADFDLTNQDFTIEGWVRFVSLAGVQQVFSRWLGGQNQIGFWAGAGFGVYISTTGSNSILALPYTSFPAINTWYHYAVCRSGADLKLFINGTQAGSTYNIGTSALHSSTNALSIGADALGNLNGHHDDFRWTTGTGRYTSAFTPPTEAHPDS
jgi:hypothetical protein